MTVYPNGHTTGCQCNLCIWAEWDGATKVSRFNIFTDVEIGHLYAVLRPGRMLAEVTAEIERRRKYYEAKDTPKNCDNCHKSGDLSIWHQDGVNLYYCPSCFEAAQEEYYASKSETPREVDWTVERRGRGYPKYQLRCECGWTYEHPSSVVAKLAQDEHKCYPKRCKHGLTPSMGCAVCTDNDYSYRGTR